MKEKVSTDDAPKAQGLLSQAIVSSGFIFVAGQIHITPEGQMIEGTTEERVQQIMKNCSAILKAASVDFSNVVKTTVYVTDMSDMKELNRIYASYFSEPFPAREAVCAKELPLGASIEISMIAAK